MGNVRFPGRCIQLKTNREEHYYSKWSSLVCSYSLRHNGKNTIIPSGLHWSVAIG